MFENFGGVGKVPFIFMFGVSDFVSFHVFGVSGGGCF